MSDLRDIINKFNKTSNEDIVSEGIKLVDYDSIPFTSPMLNYMLHGGFPRGKVVEFFGLESSGKTTTAIDVCANAQKIFLKEFNDRKKELEDKLNEKSNKQLQTEYDELLNRGILKVVYFDLEQTFDEKWAKKLGLNTDEVLFVRPVSESAESLLQLAQDMIESGQVGLVVLDSVPSFVSEAELEKTLDEKTRGGNAQLFSVFLKKTIPLLNKNKASLILINQMRDSMNPYEAYTTPGGKAIKFYSSVRLFFKEGSPVDNENNEISKNSSEIYGNVVSVRIEKTKICRPDRLLGSYILNYFDGIDYLDGLVSLLLANGYIKQAGSFFTLIDENGEVKQNEGKEIKVQGKKNLKKLFLENSDILDYYKLILNKIIKN